ncbi:MAG: AEC family transporter [Fimbriimonadaceae bacterium]|nr:AEC family transporter [Fimbriimonadaceae bacterium]
MDVLAHLSHIFGTCIFPLLALIGLGCGLQRRMGLEMRTLSRLNIYVFVPALAISALAKANLPVGDLLRVVGFVLGIQALLYALGQGWSRLRGYPRSLATAFTIALIFYNSGNYGYALAVLLYGQDSPAVGLQAIVLAVQNVTCFSLGQVLIRGPRIGVRSALGEYFRLPLPYAIVAGLVLQRTGWRPPEPVWNTIQVAAGGLVPIALVTLGAQLGLTRLDRRLKTVLVACAMRLLVAPLLALLLLLLLGWQGLLAQHLFLSTCVPTAVNTTILAVEFDNEPDFAAQVVTVSTLLSAVSVTACIYLSQLLYAG